MDGGGNRGEAERWLFTANKLLSARDLHGARSFAIRARECDPRFEASELLIAVIDTLMAGEARISDHHVDWYAVLQVIRYTHNIDYIAAQYQRLAVLLDPHRNPFSYAAHAYALLHDAWSVLSNPTKKAIFDHELRVLTEPPPPPPPPPPQVAPPAPILPQVFPIMQQSQNLNQAHNQSQSHHNQSHHHQHHHSHQNHQPQQLQEQELLSARQNPRARAGTSAVVTEEEEERPIQGNVTESTQPDPPPPPPPAPAPTPAPARASEASETTEGRTFWTACPYCYVMYEYPKVYEECTLLCQSCRRGFTAVAVRSPPSMNGKDGTFCSWGFIPLGFSGDFKDISGNSSKWNPFAPLFPCPLKGASNRRYQRGPYVYYDREEEAAFVELSDTTDDDSDDGDWRVFGNKRGTGRKRARRGRKSFSAAGDRRPVGRPRKVVLNNNNGAGNGNVNGGEALDGASSEVPVAARQEASKKAALVGPRRRGAGNLGKLDLNVEFSNEVEEPASGARARHGNANGQGNAEDNIEGIGFFEGLDEFLSSLPILNVVADDKVKGH